jgi:hypothetical protein
MVGASTAAVRVTAATARVAVRVDLMIAVAAL